MGVSLVFHPRNPYAPTVHMNVRMLARHAGAGRAGVLVRRRHGPDALLRLRGRRRPFPPVCKNALEPFGADKYPRFKTWCDEYFFLKHRDEQRGIGGIFFDDFAEGGFDERLRADELGGRRFPGRLPADPERAQGHALWRARTRFPAVPARPLRRIQPGLGPRHALRPAVGRAHRVDPDVDAAAGQLGLPAHRPSPARPRTTCTRKFLVRRDWV